MNKKGKHIGSPQFQPMRRTVKQLARNMVHQAQQQHKLKTEALTHEVLAAVKQWHEAGTEMDFLEAGRQLKHAWMNLEAHVKGGCTV